MSAMRFFMKRFWMLVEQARQDGDIEKKMLFENAESLANNLHAMDAGEAFSALTRMLGADFETMRASAVLDSDADMFSLSARQQVNDDVMQVLLEFAEEAGLDV